RRPFFPKATLNGEVKAPGPAPPPVAWRSVPTNSRSWLPAAFILTMRLLKLSATQIDPSGATLTPHGALKRVLEPAAWMIAVQVPVDGLRFWIRLLSVSAPHTVPS